MRRNIRKKLLKYGSKASYVVITLIAAVLLAVIGLNIMLVFGMTSRQTKSLGTLQLESIRSDLQMMLSEAQNDTARVALRVEQMMEEGFSEERMEAYLKEEKALQSQLSQGACINVYAAGPDWAVLPDSELPAGFRAPDRIWYQGALEHPDSVYISAPYQDLNTGGMCFTTAVLLPDGETVVAMDFNFSQIHASIQRMGGEALIVTSDGLILGCGNMDYVGRPLAEVLPEYEPVFYRTIRQGETAVFEEEMSGREYTFFTSRTDNGWYLILGMDGRALHRDGFRQVIFGALLNLFLVGAVVALYLLGCRSRDRAERALAVKEEFLSGLSGELKRPLRKILKLSRSDLLEGSDDPREQIGEIRESTLMLSTMIDNLLSYSDLMSSEKKKAKRRGGKNTSEQVKRVGRYVRGTILVILVIVTATSIYFNVNATMRWGNTKMQAKVNAYEYRLSEWLTQHRSILEMFANFISVDPALADDYDEAVRFLDGIARRYPDISAAYLANPYKEHTVIMNNGWQPDDGWKVEERQWYIDTKARVSGFSVSDPYYDERTGSYCVTMSKVVFGENGEFLGIFGMDFYLDKLLSILGEDYGEDGYAFLVDGEGTILNHPNEEYQHRSDHAVNVEDLPYQKAFETQTIRFLKDYDGAYRVCIAKHNDVSNFTIVVVQEWRGIYGNIVLYAFLLFLLFGAGVASIYSLMNRLLFWEQEVNVQLKEAAEAALQAGEAKSQFLAQMSHEIRTPINAVLGMNEMIYRESGDKDIREYAENIRSAGNTLLALINSILDFSKIEDGKMEIVPMRYDTVSLINDLVNMIADKAEKKGLLFELDIDPGLPRILYGDDVRVRQIILNMLTNAVKYTQEGSVKLKMAGRVEDADTIVLRVDVIDTGIGIREEDRDKLFQSFQRLDVEKNHNIEGTGLGISIIQKLLNMMESRLEVDSTYGEGSDFYFELRQQIVNAEPIGDYRARRSQSEHDEEKQVCLYAPDARILLVDDNEMNLRVAEGLMKRCGIRPDKASGGRECIDLARQRHYDIILMDHMMPGMDGIETLKRLREEGILPEDTAVIALTANAIVGVRERYLAAGFDDYLSKPLEAEVLEKKLEEYLPREKVSHKEVETPEASKPDQQEEDSFTLEELKEIAAACPQLNVFVGLTYCADSRELYLEMLRGYGAGTRDQELEGFWEKEDWENYRIQVHALKSTALTIGAVLLSEHARLLEAAAKSGDLEYLRAHHEEVMEEYRSLKEGLCKLGS